MTEDLGVRDRQGRGALSGLRVVDCGVGIAGPMVGMFMADFGADVVKVELPRGDAERARPGFQVWNRGKRSLVVDPAQSQDRAGLQELLDSADVWLLSSTSTPDSWGLDMTSVRRRNSRLVVMTLPPYLPSGTPWAGGAESGPLLSAWGGEHWRQSSHDGGPVDSVFRHTLTVHGIWATACTVAALIERERSGVGQAVNVSGAQAIAVSMVGSYTVDVDAPDVETAIGSTGRHPTYSRFEGRDGKWLACGALGAKFETALLAAIGLADVMDAPGIDGNPVNLVQPANIGWVRDKVRAAFRTRDRDEWLTVVEQAGIPCGAIGASSDWLDNTQIRSIGMCAEVDTSAGQRIEMAEVPIRLLGSPGSVESAAPALGSTSFDDVGWPIEAEHDPGTGTVRPGPLAGTRVLNLGTFVASPYAGSLLAELGAEVVKVEPLTGDPFRRSGFTFNRGMRSFAVDLKSADGLHAFHQLVRSSDAVLHAMRPGVAADLGVSHDQLTAIRADIITLSLSAYGEGGPMSHMPGVDMVIQGMCGLMTSQGGDSDPTPNTIAIIDVTSACLTVLATTLSLLHRARSGEGQRMWNALAATATFLQAAETVRVDGHCTPPVGGPDFKGPTGTDRYFRTADGWLRVALGDGQVWDAELLAAHEIDVDPNDLERDPGGAVAASLATLTGQEAMCRLTAAGIPAVRARRISEVLRDESLIESEIFHFQRSDDDGFFSTPGRLATFSRTQRRGPMRVPGVGEDTRMLLVRNGLTDSAIDALIAGHAVATGTAAHQGLPPAYR